MSDTVIRLNGDTGGGRGSDGDGGDDGDGKYVLLTYSCQYQVKFRLL